MGIDLGTATLAKTRTRTIRAATATTTLSVFAFRTSFHARFIRLRGSATVARTGRSVLIGMANASKVGCYMCAWRKCPPTAPLLPASMQDFGMSSFGQLKKFNTHLAFNKENCDVAPDLHATASAPWSGRNRKSSGSASDVRFARKRNRAGGVADGRKR